MNNVSQWERLRLLVASLGVIVLAAFLQGCGVQSHASLKILNATETEAQFASIQVNGRQISTEPIALPPHTAQKYSPAAHVANVSLSGGETLAVTFVQNGRSMQSSCAVAPHPEGVCLVQARYAGRPELTCWYDCATYRSK